MILIQLLLIVAIIIISFRFLANPDSHRIRAWKKMIGILFVISAIAAVLSPGAANYLASFLGVGRGADLLLYTITVGGVFAVLNGYIRAQKERREKVILARKIAIIEAVERYSRPAGRV